MYRGRLSLLAVLALAASLLAFSNDRAAAGGGVVDHPAVYSACTGPAAESAGFRDMQGSFAESAADCLAYYNITAGTGEGTFSPNVVLPRRQMALFLARAASPAGITLLPTSDQGFTDLEHMAPRARDSINQLAALGIMPGPSETTFSPYAEVTRQDMALLLSNFLKKAPAGPGGADIRTIRPDDDVFEDLDLVTPATYVAIRNLFEMGVTSGTSANLFSPDAPVSRAQMAVFITRMLAHTNARPAGLTIQVPDTDVFQDSTVSVAISLRDPDINRSPSSQPSNPRSPSW